MHGKLHTCMGTQGVIHPDDSSFGAGRSAQVTASEIPFRPVMARPYCSAWVTAHSVARDLPIVETAIATRLIQQWQKGGSEVSNIGTRRQRKKSTGPLSANPARRRRGEDGEIGIAGQEDIIRPNERVSPPLQPTKMLLVTAASAFLIAPALASWLPSPGEVIEQASELVHSYGEEFLAIDESFWDASSGSRRKKCTLRSRGADSDDTDGFEKAVKECGIGGIINLPDDK